jgi:hypothetical protein
VSGYINYHATTQVPKHSVSWFLSQYKISSLTNTSIVSY